MKHGRAEHLRVVQAQEDLAELAEWRGISLETLTRAELWRDDSNYYYPWRIPYLNMTGYWYDRGRLAEGLEPPKGKGKYDSPKRAHPHLYNPLRLGPNASEVWFAEGEFDTLALIDAGVPAIGYPGVNTIVEYDDADDDKTEKVRFRRSWKLLFDHCIVVAAGDPDEKGMKAVRGILRAFAPNAYHFKVPSQYDINDWWKEDPDGMLEAIDGFRRTR